MVLIAIVALALTDRAHAQPAHGDASTITLGPASIGPGALADRVAGGWLAMEANRLGIMLLYFDDTVDGGYERAATLERMPERIAASAGAGLVVFPSVSTNAGGALSDRASVRGVREIRVTSRTGGLHVFSSPRARPHLPGDGELRGLTGTLSGVWAALLDHGPEGMHLHLLDHEGAWRLAPWPEGIDSSAAHLVSIGEQIVIADRTAAVAARLGSGEDTADITWERLDLARPRSASLATLDGALASWWVTEASELAVELDTGVQMRHPMAGEPRVLTAGRSLVAVSVEPGRTSLMALVVDAEGRAVHDGPASSRTAERARSIELLTLFASAMLAACVLLIVMPSATSTQSGVVALPEGVALAEPPRRFIATLVDAMPGLFLVSVMWAGESESAAAAMESLAVGSGPWPWLVFGALTIAHTTALETLFGRTIGKAVVSCRTIGADGEPVTWRVSLWRNTTKTVFPFVGAAVLARPWTSRPGAAGSWVVVDVIGEAEPDSKGAE
ncbi:MAG: RDD family protein [Planctomycetota bacterium]